MTKTEISELREAVLQLWDVTKDFLWREDLGEKINNMNNELAKKIFDGSAKQYSFETTKQKALIALLEGYHEKEFANASLEECKEAAVISLDTYLEKLKSVSLDSPEKNSLSPKIKWEGTIRQLIYLCRSLSKKGLIPNDKLPSAISNPLTNHPYIAPNPNA